MYYLSCSRLLWFVNWSPSQVVLHLSLCWFLGPLTLFDQDDGLWSYHKLSSEIKWGENQCIINVLFKCVNWSPSQVVLPFPRKCFLGPLNLFDQDDGLWSHLKLSSEIKSQMRWKSKDATFLPFDRDRSRHSHFIMKPADNGEDDKYFSIWSKRGSG